MLSRLKLPHLRQLESIPAKTKLDTDCNIIWKAKNLPPDPQTLLQLGLWQTGISFWNDSDSMIAVGTAYGELRVYDYEVQRRPTVWTSKKYTSKGGQRTALEERVTSVQCLLKKNK